MAIPFAAVLSWTAATLLCGCGEEHKRYVANAGDGWTTPTMATLDVSTLISDSGYTRYHLTAPVWLMFEDADEPFWRFPGGLELQQYDLDMKPTSNVVCDSAVYHSRKRIWELIGNVVMVNTEADSFLTQKLFWDQSARKIYSDSFIHIVRTDRIIEGYGFESDQSMRYFTVNHPTAILPVERGVKKDTIGPDSSMIDSTRHAVRRRPRVRPSEAAAAAEAEAQVVADESPKTRDRQKEDKGNRTGLKSLKRQKLIQ